MMKRKSGVLLPIFSLKNDYGIGSFGKEAKKFIDFLRRSKQTVWQILPLVQTGFGNSPYQSVSASSFNPYFISVDELFNNGLITKSDLESQKTDEKYIDYDALNRTRLPLLRKAFDNFDVNGREFLEFKKSQKSRDYALFMAIKEKTNGLPFYSWSDDLKLRDKKALDIFEKENETEVNFWLFTQYEAKRQWFNLKKYANDNGISIIGDIPLYVALDSEDVWKNPNLFKLNEDFSPKKVAGVPPDYFSETGQLWGNPVYDYCEHEKEGFAWWTERISLALEVYDYVRIDHFRGFDRYYEIENGALDAKVGEWVKVPSEKLFNVIHKTVDKERVIAEDLGIIDDGVRNLLKFVGYPGMKILQFAFDSGKDNLYLPENITENSVCYTGTHDNDTLQSYVNSLEGDLLNRVINNVQDSLKALKINKKIKDKKSLAKAIIELGYCSKSNLFVIPLFDLSLKTGDYRINEPGTIKRQNWAVRSDKKSISILTGIRLANLTKKYNRI